MKMCSCRPGSPWYVARHRFYSSPLLLHLNELASLSTARPRFSCRLVRVLRSAPLLFNWIFHPLSSPWLSSAASEPRVCLSVNLSAAVGWCPVGCVGIGATGTQQEQMEFRNGFLIMCINAAIVAAWGQLLKLRLPNLDLGYTFASIFFSMFTSIQNILYLMQSNPHF